MKRKGIYENESKSKKPFLGPIDGSEAPTSSSTLITSTPDLMPSIHARDATASAQVTASASVSVQLRHRFIKY